MQLSSSRLPVVPQPLATAAAASAASAAHCPCRHPLLAVSALSSTAWPFVSTCNVIPSPWQLDLHPVTAKRTGKNLKPLKHLYVLVVLLDRQLGRRWAPYSICDGVANFRCKAAVQLLLVQCCSKVYARQHIHMQTHAIMSLLDALALKTDNAQGINTDRQLRWRLLNQRTGRGDCAGPAIVRLETGACVSVGAAAHQLVGGGCSRQQQSASRVVDRSRERKC